MLHATAFIFKRRTDSEPVSPVFVQATDIHPQHLNKKIKHCSVHVQLRVSAEMLPKILMFELLKEIFRRLGREPTLTVHHFLPSYKNDIKQNSAVY